MVDWIIVQAASQGTMVAHSRRGYCRSNDDDDQRCDACTAYADASNRFRNLIFPPDWTVSGLPDQAEPPHCLCGNPGAQARWIRAWELRCELVRRAKLRLGET